MTGSSDPARSTAEDGPWDPISLEIYWSRLIAIVDEAAATLIRTSFSTVVRDAHDFACMLMDTNGDSVANSTISIPVFLGSISRTMKHFLDRYPLDQWQPGDVGITNDPWLSTGHLRDITLARPIFVRGELVAFAAATAHMPDIGGTVWSADARELYEEGLRIPITKLYYGGELNQQLMDLLRANVRVPEQVQGDLFATVASTEVVAARLEDLLLGEGLQDFGLLARTIQARSEQAMREAITRVPDGVYRSEIWGDGLEEPGARLQCTITVDGDSMHVDYDGSSPQVRKAINSVLYHTIAYTVAPLKSLLDPLTPNNEGALRPLTVAAPEGSVLNPRFPAAVDARSLVSHYIHAALFSALAPAMPDRVIGHCGGPGVRAVLSGTRNNRAFWTVIFSFGGMGARATKDGLNSTSFPTIASNPPIEILERSAPIVVLEKELICDSGGPGRYRGGSAHSLRVLIAGDRPMECSLMAERINHPPLGVLGGGAGSTMRIVLNEDGYIDPKSRTEVRPGDIVTILSPGGGGYGPAKERGTGAVARDVHEGYVSRDAALRIYGVEVDTLDRALAELGREKPLTTPKGQTIIAPR